MSREDLFDWIMAHDCEQVPLKEYQAKVIFFRNRKTNKEAWIDLPINKYEVRDFTVIRVCSRLGIPFPECSKHMQPFNDHIESLHFSPKELSNKKK